MIKASLHEMLPVYHKLSILNLGTMPQSWCGGLITPYINQEEKVIQQIIGEFVFKLSGKTVLFYPKSKAP